MIPKANCHDTRENDVLEAETADLLLDLHALRARPDVGGPQVATDGDNNGSVRDSSARIGAFFVERIHRKVVFFRGNSSSDAGQRPVSMT